jgi:hypothetical protein
MRVMEVASESFVKVLGNSEELKGQAVDQISTQHG